MEQAVGVIDGDFDADARLSGNDGIVEVAIVVNETDDMKGIGIFQAIQQLAALTAAVGVKNHSVDLTDVGVNSEAKHNHLQQRNDEREEQRRRIAANVQDFLVKDRAEAAEKVTHERPPAALDACR